MFDCCFQVVEACVVNNLDNGNHCCYVVEI